MMMMMMLQTNHWFKITLKIPAAWRDYERVQCESGCLDQTKTYSKVYGASEDLWRGTEQMFLSLLLFPCVIGSPLFLVVQPRARARYDTSWQFHLGQIVEFDTSSEALIFTPEGSPIHGLTGGFGIERRVEYIIPERFWKPKGSSGVYEIYVEGSCNGLFGIDNMDPPDVSREYRAGVRGRGIGREEQEGS
jgi:hypothetical protein